MTLVIILMLYPSSSKIEVVIHHADRPRDTVIEVVGTIYDPVVAQCDSRPLETADGSIISSSSLRWVALSRNLIARWGGPFEYGDTIHVWHPDERLRGRWVVHDCMNARYTDRMDFLRSDLPGKTNGILISKTKIK